MDQQPALTLDRPAPDAASATATGAVEADAPFLDVVEHSLDAKSRLTLPAAHRAAFVDGAVLTIWRGPCLAVLTQAGYSAWIDRLKQVLPDSGLDDPSGTLVFAHTSSTRVKPDIQGRFQLPERFRTAAGIDRDVTLVGAGSRIEVWNPASYGPDSAEHRRNLEYVQTTVDFDL